MPADKPWRDKETLDYLYNEKGMTMAEVGDRLGASGSTIGDWINKYSIKEKSMPWRDEEWLQEKYHEEAKSMADIAEEVDTCPAVISKWCKRHGIETRKNKLRKDHPAKDREKLVEMHYSEGMTVAEMAEHFDVSRSVIKRLFERYDIERLYYSDLKDKTTHFVFYTGEHGYELIGVTGKETTTARLHHLQMCVEHDPHVVYHPDIITHHENRLRWDNRLENLSFMTQKSHSKHHMDRGDTHNLDESGYNDRGAGDS